MAIEKTTYKGTYVDNHQEFTCDFRDDISTLPTQYTTMDRCPTGSRAFVIEDSSRWILNSQGEWIQIFLSGGGAGSGSGSGSGGDLDIATPDEVDSMLDDIFSN